MCDCPKKVSLAMFYLITITLLLLVGTASAAAPDAAFSGIPTSGTAPLTVAFTDASTGGPTGWAWFFGDETYDEPWTNQTATPGADAGWSARQMHTSVAMPDGSIVLMGGEDESGRLNDTWRSTDGGATWTEVNASAGWTARQMHTSVALPNGSIVLMGGYNGTTYFNDTWRSTDGGATWTNITPQDPGDLWTARWGHTSVALPDGSIVLMGGWDSRGWLNDTWQSTDGGATWTNQTATPGADAGWSARLGHSSVALPDGSIVVMGGMDDSVGFRNDVWRSTDGGATWTEVNGSSGWTARDMHTSVALPDGSIVLMGGSDSPITPMNDVWRSIDGGAHWTNITPQDPGDLWTARHAHTSVALPDGSIVIMGGNNGTNRLNDTWQLQPAGSSLQNPTHTYTAPGTYSPTLQAFNADGYDSTQRIDYIMVTAAPAPTPTSRPVYSGGGGGGSTGGPDGYNVGGDSAVSKVAVAGTGLKTFIITGWKQSSPGTGIPPAPGTPYQYVDLVPARFEEITGANITFSVPVAWLDEHGFTPEEIVLYHYNGTAWEALPTTVKGTAGTTVTFTAMTPGFSLFAISGIEKTGEAVTTPTATTPPATAEPTATETAAAPAGGPAPEFPLGTVALVAGIVLVLAGAGYLVRRWWIIRQNPALFRDYD
ncbi:Galactose oxidase, central domain [anaerobic digester metagenome]